MFTNEDALELLSRIQDNSIDLVLTDPPYIISRKSGFKAKGEKGVERFRVSIDFGEWDNSTIPDHEKLMMDVFKEYYRVLKTGGTLICWYDIWKLQSLASYGELVGFRQPRLIEWQKTNPVPLNSKRNYLTNSREVALSVVKGGKPTFNSEYDNGVYSYPIHRDGGKRLHPTQKPLELTRELIRKHSNVGDSVLDTFAGSATHYIAALQTGRTPISCEKDSGYFKIAKERIENATLDLNRESC